MHSQICSVVRSIVFDMIFGTLSGYWTEILIRHAFQVADDKIDSDSF
jgi:hypothetical protein